MSEMTPEKAREYLKTLGSMTEESVGLCKGYLERDAQLRPLIEGLVGALEKVKSLAEIRNSLDMGEGDHNRFLKIANKGLILAHKAGFGKEKK